MKREFKNIISFFLLITGLVIFSHSIIPHDHHYDVMNTTHHEHHNDENSGSEPIHCHYFNEIIFDKTILSFNNQILKQIPTNFALIFDNKFSLDNNLSPKTLFFKKDNLPDYFVFIENSPTRGSPTFNL